jgi:hypothetical protein
MQHLRIRGSQTIIGNTSIHFYAQRGDEEQRAVKEKIDQRQTLGCDGGIEWFTLDPS